MKLSGKRTRERRLYVPEFSDNRKLPEGERVTVEILSLTPREKQRFATTAVTVVGPNPDDVKVANDVDMVAVINTVLHDNVGTINNLELDDGPIASGADLAEVYEKGDCATEIALLIAELTTAVLEHSQLSEGLAKN